MWAQIEFLVEELKASGPVTLLIVLLAGGAMLYVVLAQVIKSLRLLRWLVGQLVPQATTQSKPVGKAKAVNRMPVIAEPAHKQPGKPGKSLKSLLKESKKAEAEMHSTEKGHPSEHFLSSLKGHGGAVYSADIAPSDSHVLTACADETLRIFDFKGDWSAAAPAVTKQALDKVPVGARFWGDERTSAAVVASLGAEFVVTRTERVGSRVNDHTVLAERELHGSQESIRVAGASTSGGGRPVMASLTHKKEIKVIVGPGAVRATLEPSGIENYEVAVSRDGRFIAAATWGSDVKLWELAFTRDGAFKSCDKAMELKGHRQGVLSVAFSPDTSKAVTASRDGTLRIWNIAVRYHMSEDPKCLVDAALNTPDKQPYTQLCWCPSGVIVGAVGHRLHYINAKTGKVAAKIEDAHSKRITGICASAAAVTCGGGRKECVVVTSSMDGKARIWIVPDADNLG